MQLDATASVPGTFVYTPPAGTYLSVGQGKSLSATFTPTDATYYTTATGSTTINVVTPAPSPTPTPTPTATTAPTPTPTPAPTPLATVQGVRWGTIKVKKKSEKVLVAVSPGTHPAAAQNLADYQLLAAAREEIGTSFSKPIAIASAVYSPSAYTVTLTPRGQVPNEAGATDDRCLVAAPTRQAARSTATTTDSPAATSWQPARGGPLSPPRPSTPCA